MGAPELLPQPPHRLAGFFVLREVAQSPGGIAGNRLPGPQHSPALFTEVSLTSLSTQLSRSIQLFLGTQLSRGIQLSWGFGAF
ncbi:hypothetical protein GDO81_030210 [Engystomops pustulosus]|uniref:Uncharacterized protein n=1 Tax=Engystomops pustulosus TaxID=76066 RepID=A0AAV6YDE9_ENGPU|nr:hypothetical protein GDO81_030210 [Engystomops pustulosus]